jgi:major membrane immunogen (membrane-anchored lipoprotein)
MDNKEAKQAAQKYFESLSETELNSIKSEFKLALDSFIDKEVIKLEGYKKALEEEAQKLAQNRLNQKELSEKSDYSGMSDLYKVREGIQGIIAIRQSQIMNQENVVQALTNFGGLTELTDKKGFVHKNIADFREINSNEIVFDETNILSIAKPKYIPNIDEEAFARKGYVFDAIRISKDSYILSTSKYKDTVTADYSQPFVIVTLDQLVLTLDYYFKKAKAQAIAEAKRKTIREEENYDKLSVEQRDRYMKYYGIYGGLPAAVRKKITKDEWDQLDLEGKEKLYKPIKKYGSKKLTSKLDEKSMWASFHSMYERFINPQAMPKNKDGIPEKNGRFANPEVWEYWSAFREMMDFKIKDIRIQREDIADTYKKALETSFGESNVSDILKSRYGILVKRQNGDVINPLEVTQISSAWERVQSIFGNLKPNALKYNLKVSHAGKKLIFAMKAIGVYIPQMGTIGVSEKYGDKQFESTMSHEVAHFIDNFIGELNGKRWATDDYEGKAGVLSFTFRNNMNKPKSQQSDYINATKECFARAMQQYFAYKVYGKDALVIQEASEGEATTPIYNASNFVSFENFESKIKPLIEDFFAENEDVFKTTVDLDESNEIEPIGTETSVPENNVTPTKNPIVETENISDLIEGLEILSESMNDKEKEEILDVIEGLKLLA